MTRTTMRTTAGRTMRGAIRVTGWLLAIFAVLLLFLVGIGPRLLGYRTLTVYSGSMGKVMPAGSIAIVTSADVAELKVGDVISFRAPEGEPRMVTHRIVSVVEPGPRPIVQTQGDANQFVDKWMLSMDRPVWRVQRAVPFVGYFINAVRRSGLAGTATQGLPWIVAAVVVVGIWRPSRRDTLADQVEALTATAAPNRYDLLPSNGSRKHRHGVA